jgi:hypothetical protein
VSPVTASKGYSLDGWPTRGYTGPQPWDADALGIPRSARDEVGEKPNTVTPVVSHQFPILTSGSAHACVHELGRKLHELGFANSVGEGKNPFGTVDQSVLAAVNSFRAHYGVRPDPSGFGGDTPQGNTLAANHLDPWTIEGILRAHQAEFGS